VRLVLKHPSAIGLEVWENGPAQCNTATTSTEALLQQCHHPNQRRDNLKLSSAARRNFFQDYVQKRYGGEVHVLLALSN